MEGLNQPVRAEHLYTAGNFFNLPGHNRAFHCSRVKVRGKAVTKQGDAHADEITAFPNPV
jgi:hypothetical protein